MQAGLKWTIGKRRQQSCDFLGGEVGCLSLISGLDAPELRGFAVILHRSGSAQHEEALHAPDTLDYCMLGRFEDKDVPCPATNAVEPAA